MQIEDKLGPTLKDVADAAGVSVTAVSKVLNNRGGVSAASREKVLRIAEELGYRGRSGRPSAAIDRLTVVTLDRYVTNNPFFNEIIEGALDAAGAEGIPTEVSVVTSASLADGSVDLWRSPPGAAILVGLDRRDVIDRVCAAGVPAVIVNGMDRDMRISSVSPDYHFGGWAATRHLLDLGHRSIAHVTHPHRESLKRRFDGFRDALEEAGIGFDPAVHLLDVGHPDMISIDARPIIERFLAGPGRGVTALFCVADIVALGAVRAAESLGLDVPGDLSVVGFDDLAIGAHSTPPLTTVRIDRRDLARIAVQTLIERIAQGRSAVRRINVGVELVLRESTAPPRESRPDPAA